MTLPKLELAKPGDAAPKPLRLNLNKGDTFTVELCWKSSDDLDGHALLCSPTSAGGKITALSQVLSTYNPERVNNPNKSFTTPCGGLSHSGDCRDGVDKDIDEVITINGAKISNTVSEVPIFVTIHDPGKTGKTFAGVKEATIAIKDGSGTKIGAFELSKEFAPFNIVQMGSLLRGDNGWEYAAVGNGLNGDFNTILEHFAA
jgi:tellurium resistance protein TerD